MKKVLGIFCHPDDEILAGWPIFQSEKLEKHLIICCDDYARRGSCRRQALQEVCKQENINLVKTLSEDNNFYALPTRRADSLLSHSVFRINNALEQAIEDVQPDFIMTHNPVGEYGHGSHRLLFEIVSQHLLAENILITDICQESNHRSSKEIPQVVRDAYYKDPPPNGVLEILNMDFYNRCKAIYDSHNAWTWSKESIKHCNLFLLKKGSFYG